MSHPEQTKFITDSLEVIRKEFANPHVLEVGSYNVNSIVNYKNFIGKCNYTGVDLVSGPGVDLVIDGENIDQINKKFDLIICAECFEHAENWKKIFEKMIYCIKDKGYIILTIASTGRDEHGTKRTINSDSPGTGDYYKNLTKKDFFKNFKIKKLFNEYFFFYNIHSYDLYIILKKEKNNDSIDLIKKKYLKLEKKLPIRNLKRYILNYIFGDKIYQNLRLFSKNRKK